MTEEKQNGEVDAQDDDKQESEIISELLAKVKEDAQAIEELKKRIEADVKEINQTKDSVEGDSVAAKAAQEVINACSESASESADKIQKLKNETEPLTAQLLAKIQGDRKDVIALLGEIETAKVKAKSIADTADEKDQRVDEYEQQLIGLRTEYSELKEQIEGLISGATSGNLAFATKARKDSFKWPKRFWTLLQIAAVGSLVWFGFWILDTTEIGDSTTMLDIVFLILLKSPVIAAIILLEEFARRNRNIVFRLEEDYGYKEVISSSFEGYRREMEKVDLAEKNIAVSKLSTNLLDAMAKEPGRAFDKEKHTSLDSILSKAALAQVTGSEGETKESLLSKVYEDVKKTFRGNFIKMAIVIAITIAVGIGIGFYLGRDTATLDLGKPTPETTQSIQSK